MPETVGNRSSKLAEKNVAFAGTIVPDVMTDVFRAQGGILLFNKLGVIDTELLDKFTECFDELNTRLIGVKGLIPSR